MDRHIIQILYRKYKYPEKQMKNLFPIKGVSMEKRMETQKDGSFKIVDTELCRRLKLDF